MTEYFTIPNNKIISLYYLSKKYVIPEYNKVKAEIVKIMKPMVKIEGIAFDYSNRKDINNFFSGWLPLNEIEILEDLGGSVNG